MVIFQKQRNLIFKINVEMKPGQNWQNPIKPGGVVRKSWVFPSVGRMEGPWWRASVWQRRMGSLFTLAIRLIIKLSPLALGAGHWWLWICACKHLKNSGHKVETNLSHRSHDLCLTAVSWVALGRRESGNQHSHGALSPSPLSMCSSNCSVGQQESKNQFVLLLL